MEGQYHSSTIFSDFLKAAVVVNWLFCDVIITRSVFPKFIYSEDSLEHSPDLPIQNFHGGSLSFYQENERHTFMFRQIWETGISY